MADRTTDVPVAGRTEDVDQRVDRRAWITLGGVCCATFMVLLDLTVINVALPAIQRDLNASYEDVLWVLDAYSITLAAFLLAVGSASDRFGSKVTMITGLVGFTLASFACGVSTTAAELYVSRGVQGVFAAVLYALGPALIARTFPRKKRPIAMAAFGAVSGLAIAAGPLIGGYLTDLNWRWVFFIKIPVGAVAIVVMLLGARTAGAEKFRFDLPGAALMIGALVLLCGSIIRANSNGWLSVPTFVGEGAGLCLIVLFALRERRLDSGSTHPLLDMRLFSSRSFLSLSVSTFCFNFGVNVVMLFAVLWMEGLLGYGPISTGLRFSPLTVVLFIGGALGGALISKFSTRALMTSALLLAAAGFALLLLTGDSSAWTAALPGFIVAGFGMGMHNPPRANGAVELFPEKRAGMASGANETFQQAGVAFGIAVLGTVGTSLARNHIEQIMPGASTTLKNAAALGLRPTGAPPSIQHAITDSFLYGAHAVYGLAAAIALLGAAVAFLGIRSADIHPDHTEQT